jgi:hypothetical protein
VDEPRKQKEEVPILKKNCVTVASRADRIIFGCMIICCLQSDEKNTRSIDKIKIIY